jgi:16S rRNA (cytosine967-C5)-methyltransferase
LATLAPWRLKGAAAQPETARSLALEILQRVEKTDAYANLLLDAWLRKRRLAAADRALATELTYGVLRWQGKLDYLLGRVLDRPILVLDPPVRHILRLGTYQLCCLDRIPDFAAVDEAVELTRWAGVARSAGYVNAVLRAIVRGREEPPPVPARDPHDYWSSLGSHPRWLVERWIARLGAEEAGRLMAANNEAPPLGVVVNQLKAGIQEARGVLPDAGVEVQPGRFVAGAFSLRGAGAPEALQGFREGWLIPMDEAGALPVLALRLGEGLRALDACAGGGSKSALMAGAVGWKGEIVALDQSPRAIRRLEAARRRLGLEMVKPQLQDARAAGAMWPRGFARVLLDAPCTGLGTIRRRPEIKWRRRAEDLPRAARLQAELLEGVAAAVAEDGLLVYSTCSLEPEETDGVVEEFLRTHPEFRREDPAAAVASRADLVGADGFLRAWPHRHGTDGFFVACLRRGR